MSSLWHLVLRIEAPSTVVAVSILVEQVLRDLYLARCTALLCNDLASLCFGQRVQDFMLTNAELGLTNILHGCGLHL